MSSVPPGRHRLTVAVLTLSLAGWVVPALMMAGRGFDLWDGATYLVSYRQWRTHPWFFSGGQYVLGPVYDLLGGSVRGLRVTRVLLTLAANAWFGLAFTRWWAHERGAEPTRAQLAGGTLLLTASGGLTYLWSTLTPGYYVLAGVGSLVLVALLLTLLRRPEAPGWWVPVAAGACSVLLVVAKWPTLLAVAGIAAIALAALRHAPRRTRALAILGYVAGAALPVVGWAAAGVGPGRIVHGMVETTRLFTTSSHGVGALLRDYTTSTTTLLLGAVVVAVPALLALLAARRTGSAQRARVLVVAGIVVSGLGIPLLGGWRGGDQAGRAMVVAVLSCLLVATVAAVSGGVRRPVPWPVLAVLVLVPFVQAAGTNVPLIYVAAECFAMWVAAVLVLAPDPLGVSGLPVRAALVMAAVSISLLAGTTTLMTPYRTTGFAESTAPVAALGVRVSPETAEQFAAIERTVGPDVVPGETPMVTLDRMAGLTYLLGGVQLGSPWTDPITPDATAGVIRLDCADRPLTRPPVLIVEVEVPGVVAEALRACGVDFPAGYQRREIPGGPPGVWAWVPRD